MKATASKLATTRARSASARTGATKEKSRNSAHTWKVVTRKSYTPAMPVAWSRSLAWEPPFSPVTRTSVMAVASG